MLLTLKLSDRPTLLLVRISPLVDGFEVCCLDCPSSLSTKFFTECCGVSESNGTSKNVEGNVNKRSCDVMIEEVEAKFCVIRYSGGNLNNIEDQ